MMLGLLLLAGPIRVAFVGTFAGTAELSSLLGNEYQVRVFDSPRRLTEIKAFHPNVVVMGFYMSDSWDTFVPKLKQTIAQYENLPGHPRVMCPLPPNEPVSSLGLVRSLISQAAREAGVKVFDRASASATDFATGAFFEIYDWKRAKAGWRIESADSEQADEGPAANAIDGDPQSYWHTEYSPRDAKYPHELVIDMGKEDVIGGIRYLPRQDGGVNGRIKGYEIWVRAADSNDFEGPVAAGNFPNTGSASTVFFKQAVRARYVKFRALSEQTGQSFASAAEFDVLPAKFAASNGNPFG